MGKCGRSNLKVCHYGPSQAPPINVTMPAEDHIASVGEDVVNAALPMREVTPPEDVANMVAFCASGKCRHATGSTIDITGADYVR